jgi:isoleucyl-tRNA synthetase
VLGELTAESSFTRIEEDGRRFWRRHQVSAAFHAAHQEGVPYTICQQPLLAAGESETDQVRLLATADLLARYHAMRGGAVQLGTGWVCHGLPIEITVERSLGPDVAEYDLAQFNTACRQVALDGIRQGQALSERLGIWPGPQSAFLSLEPQAIGAVWGGLRKLWDAGRLKHEHRVSAVCPRCASPLSSAEATRRAVETEGRSVWVRLPWDGEPDTYFLAWTSAPWTLVGMVALAVHPEETYALVELQGQDSTPAEGEPVRPGRLLLAEAALKRTLPAGYRRVKRLRGRALRGARYHPVFTFLPAGKEIGGVILSREVPLDRGTGLQPVTPAFDPLSLALAQDHGLPVPQLLDDWGALGEAVTPWRGLSPLDAEPYLVEDVQARGLLFAAEVEQRPQNLCPYCETPLLPLARPLWLVETGSGPWIVSRDRAWGVPLPIWTCDDCGHELCVAGLDDLARRAGISVEQIEPHRPDVDHLTFPCETCGGTMRRVPVVVDAGFEAAMLAWSTGSQKGPANLAVGLGDLRLGWLGDLAEVAALLSGSLAWEQALALPEVEPESTWDLARIPSADALRWAAFAGTTPDRAGRDVLRPLWQAALSLLGQPSVPSDQNGDDDLLDRWLAARLNQTIEAVALALDASDPRRATDELASLVSDLADWVVPYRLGGGREVLEPLSRLLAPFVPYLAEAIHRQSSGLAAPSVHLAAWPSSEPWREAQSLLVGMSHVQRWVELGKSARAQSGVAAEQRLRQAIVSLLATVPGKMDQMDPFADLLVRMLGVAAVQIVPEAAVPVRWRLTLDPEHRVERDLPPAEIEAALAELDKDESARLASQLRTGLSVGLQVSGRAITLLPDEVSFTAQAAPGWVTAADAQHLVILDVG